MLDGLEETGEASQDRIRRCAIDVPSICREAVGIVF